ncbi:CMRF35-like molecule 3 [Solea senegalensis]|uniref:CMRF35-like molecule 3 n=1 Tax=Solea senegalensis TaxID=28829 RepID=A0AAV6SWL4_SOLSE|nr:CMRF35-like molecule 3 [Solea senegalensis]
MPLVPEFPPEELLPLELLQELPPEVLLIPLWVSSGKANTQWPQMDCPHPTRNRPSDRCFIADDKEAGVFTVTMTGLQDSDDDLYWCVIAKGGLNIHTPVRLLVSHTVVTPTAFPTVVTPTAFPTVVTPTPTWTLGHDDISWWATLRQLTFVTVTHC